MRRTMIREANAQEARLNDWGGQTSFKRGGDDHRNRVLTKMATVNGYGVSVNNNFCPKTQQCQGLT